MSVNCFFKPEHGPEIHVYNPTEPGGSTAILDFLKLAFITYCHEQDEGAKIYALEKRIIKVARSEIYFPPKLDLEQHLDRVLPITGEHQRPVFHRKAGKGVLNFQHIHPYISNN